MKRAKLFIITATLLMVTMMGCNSKNQENKVKLEDNHPSIEEQRKEAKETFPPEALDNSHDETENIIGEPSKLFEGSDYKAQELLRVDFLAKTHAEVEDIKEYYSGMEEEGTFTYTSLIPATLCKIITEAMDGGMEKEVLSPLIADKSISQEEFCAITGVELIGTEEVYPVRVDADNDGIEDIVGLHYYGGTGGFSSMELYQGSMDGSYTLTQSMECFLQNYNFIEYDGKQYLLLEEFNYYTKYYSGYTLYLYENGELADGKIFSFVVDDYDKNIAFEDKTFTHLETIKDTLYNPKLPVILKENGLIYGTAERKNDTSTSNYEFTADMDNDGILENYNKWMWYPSNMGTVMEVQYEFENSQALDNLLQKLETEMSDYRLYTFWLDEVGEDNLLYLYFGRNLDYTLYAFHMQR